MLKIESLSKTYGKNFALREVSFSMGSGEIVGIVGPNGSGKTTLLNIITGMLKPSSGTYRVDTGISVGMSISRKGFFNDMSTGRNLSMYASLMGAKEYNVASAMDDFNIDFANKHFGKLSAGMRQKVSLALAFLADNDLILLDEPSNHLDIDALIKLRNRIIDLNRKGVSFIITSHIFSDLERVCDRILFLQKGELRQDTRTSELIEHYGTLEDAYLDILK